MEKLCPGCTVGNEYLQRYPYANPGWIKPALMKRLFELGSAYSGQILSYFYQNHGTTNRSRQYHHPGQLLELLHDAGLLGALKSTVPT